MAFPHVKPVTRCRMCEGTEIVPFLDLGVQPPANALLTEADLASTEARYPLALAQCRSCDLVQLMHVVSPDVLFEHYVYFSSVSVAMQQHFAAYAVDVAERFVPPHGLVVEIGSNDGILLRSLLDRDVRILGIDPAKNVSEEARASGVPTVTGYFEEVTAKAIRGEHGAASAIIANNVFAHIDDLAGVMRGVDALLADDGVFVIESPYVIDFLDGLEFDTVYHEHVSYLGVRPIARLMARFGMEIVDVQRQSVHGGSIRVFARRKAARAPRSAIVAELEAAEKATFSRDSDRLQRFATDVRALRHRLRGMVADLRRDGKRVAGYAAPAKATVMLNFCGFGPGDLDYLADATPAKQGRFVPGVRIPVKSPEHFRAHPPDYAVLFAWNHEREILDKEAAYRAAGGKFIVAIPTLRVV
jgi:SAM-dependent methyltransferase